MANRTSRRKSAYMVGRVDSEDGVCGWTTDHAKAIRLGMLHFPYPDTRASAVRDAAYDRPYSVQIDRGQLVRLAYVDEAGISNPSQEPIMVVAGFCLHGDREWPLLDARLDEIVSRYIPAADRTKFIFHATDIFSGGPYFAREKWSKEQRWEILDALCAVPRDLGFPISVGYVDREKHAARYLGGTLPTLDAATLRIAAHTEAFMQCEVGIDRWLTEKAPGELSLLIAEDAPLVKPAVRVAHQMLRDHSTAPDSLLRNIPIVTKVVDGVNFSEKWEARPLQIADVCAFVIKRELGGKTDSRRFYEALVPQIVWCSTTADYDASGPWRLVVKPRA